MEATTIKSQIRFRHSNGSHRNPNRFNVIQCFSDFFPFACFLFHDTDFGFRLGGGIQPQYKCEMRFEKKNTQFSVCASKNVLNERIPDCNEQDRREIPDNTALQ